MAKINYAFFIYSIIGAFTLYFKLLTDGRRVLRFSVHLNPDWEESVICNFIDVLLFCIIGAVIGTVITRPINQVQALTAGLGWTSLINAYVGE
jgi:uncharacterized membrane protein YbjE (DUF340 family)